MSNLLKTDMLRAIQALCRMDLDAVLDRAEKVASNANKGRNFVFVAGMPKSGSTFISKKIAEYLECDWGHVSDTPGGCEFDIYRPALIRKTLEDVVVQQHTLATNGNVEYLRRFGATVVVTLRQLPGALLSFRRHLLNESLRWPFVAIDSDYRHWDEKRQLDFLVDLVAPWMVNFVATWKIAEANDLLGRPIRFASYELLKNDEFATMASLVESVTGKPADNGKLKACLRQQKTNYRKGTSRPDGDVVFGEVQLERMKALVLNYPSVDLSDLFPKF
ncbi:hypothetical protein [Gimesia maris]|uniref:hypothetical protein n=1 Tax=Gimesia maris TaxID=122 RepID=UPI003A929B89